MDTIQIKAFAKINLSLDVLSRRPNGYHDVRMVMQTIGLFDLLTFHRSEASGITLLCGHNELPCDQSNLIYRAAKLFYKYTGITPGIRIELEKNIPVAAGMAGGSSDAAATLKALNTLYDTELALPQLQELGVQLGADVPYCLLSGTALAEGIGEILTPLAPAPDCHCLIVKPPVSVATGYVYEHLNLTTVQHPDIDAQLKAIADSDFAGLCSHLGNVLESVTTALHPEIISIKTKLLSLGADGALMSGSGPTVFGLFSDRDTAERAYTSFRNGAYRDSTWLTGFTKRI